MDLGAIDAQRGRDHGLPSYVDLRRAYGLAAPISFTAITGESTSDFPSDPKIDRRDPINDPNILDFVELRDADGNVIPLGSPEAEEEAVEGIRRSPLAPRLKAIYGAVDKVEAVVGMLSEPHVSGTEFGPLQLAIWKKQFEALRDGDRYFYLTDPGLNTIRQLYGIDYRHTLGEIIEMNTGVAVQDNVFESADVSNVNSTRSTTTTISACTRSHALAYNRQATTARLPSLNASSLGATLHGRPACSYRARE